jgi:hypothetical protein
MINQKNNALWYKVNGLSRYFLAHLASNIIPIYIINEYPKSGGSWVGEMVGSALGVPFPRNRLPMLCPSILHGHMMHSWNMNNALIVWRDGRDVLISQYYHSLFENSTGNSRLVNMCRADLEFSDYDDISSNLLAFMEYVFDKKQHPKFSWNDFAKKWANCDKCVHVHYEDLRSEPEQQLMRIISLLSNELPSEDIIKRVVSEHSFEKMSGRKAGEENTRSFMRKGVVGDWKNYFNPEARKQFHYYAGDSLVKLGYEVDDNWVYQ